MPILRATKPMTTPSFRALIRPLAFLSLTCLLASGADAPPALAKKPRPAHPNGPEAAAADVAMSNTNGPSRLDGMAKHIGLVPSRAWAPPKGATPLGERPESAVIRAIMPSAAAMRSTPSFAATRSTAVSAIELRASMIVGHGSLSWLIVRDLAARLPVMVLPRWLKSRTEPVAISDIVSALVGALDLEVAGSACFDVPGPDVLSGRDILLRTAAALGLASPLIVEVPFLSPRLSSHWVRLVTRADWSVAREIVIGLKTDLLASDASYWSRIGHRDLLMLRRCRPILNWKTRLTQVGKRIDTPAIDPHFKVNECSVHVASACAK